MQVRGARPRGRSTVKTMLQGSLVLALGAGCDLSEIAGDDEATADEAVGEQAHGLMAGPFEISLSDDSVTLGLNEGTSLLVRVEPLEGFTGDVALAVTSEPDFPGDASIFPEVVTPAEFDLAFLDIFTDCETPPGDYALTVTGTGDDGASATATALLTVEPTTFPPFASFFIGLEGFTVEFFDSSSPGGCGSTAEIVERVWDFGDGTTSTEENPTHTYAARGDYTVTLTITNDEGASDTTSAVVSVLPPPPVLSIVQIRRDPALFQLKVDLRWSGAEGDLVELHRNGVVVDLPDNDGAHRDRFRSLETSFTWRVCELGIFFCSNQVSVDLGPNLNGDAATVTTEIDGQTVVERIRIQDE